MKTRGFTLVELIIVVAIIALLAAATFVAVNPAKRIGTAQDAQRWADVTAIADAYLNYIVDHSGTAVTTTIDGTTYYIQHTAGAAATDMPSTCAATSTVQSFNYPVDFGGLVTAGYIGSIPNDPLGNDDDSVDYYFYEDATGKIIVGACATSTHGSDNVIQVVR